MIQRMVLGVIGGALVVLSVFIDGDTVAFGDGVPDNGVSWTVLGAGVVAAVFAIVGVRTLIAFGSGAATAVASMQIVDAVRSGSFRPTASLVVLVVGVLATLAATIGRRRATVAIDADEVTVAPAAKPATEVIETRPDSSDRRR